MITFEPAGLVWRTSSYSGGSGNCVEVAWRKSSYSGPNGNCVELAASGAVHLVRDSKNPGGDTLSLPAEHWRRFLGALVR